MKICHGFGAAKVGLACLAAVALTTGTASATPRQDGIVLPKKTCTIQFLPAPRVDDFIVHSTGWVTCSAFASTISGKVELRRDGVPVQSQEFEVEDAIGASAQVKTPCASGSYQATMTAEWMFPGGTEGSDSVNSLPVDVAC